MTDEVYLKSQHLRCGNESENVLGFRMVAGNLAQLCFIIAHQEVNAVLCSVFNVRHLFTDAAVDNVLRRNPMTVEQLELRLNDICKTEETVIINCCTFTEE